MPSSRAFIRTYDYLLCQYNKNYVSQLYSGRSGINVEWVAGTERKSIASILD